MLEFKLQSNVSVQARVFSMMLFKFQLTPSQEKENNGQQSPEGGNSILSIERNVSDQSIFNEYSLSHSGTLRILISFENERSRWHEGCW